MRKCPNLSWPALWFRFLCGIGAFGLTACAPDALPQENNEISATNFAGTVLVGDMDESLAANEIEPTKQRALGGDNAAANALGDHYRDHRDTAEEIRWRTLGADRGDCLQMISLKEIADRAGDRAARRHWNDRLRSHECTWAKAYGPDSAPTLRSRPLWD